MASRPPKGHLRGYVSAGEFGIVDSRGAESTANIPRQVFPKSKEANVAEVVQ